MKIKTAIHHVKQIRERIRRVNGLIGTPEAGRYCFKIRTAYVFGSTVKGKDCPNDVDILIDGREVGELQGTSKINLGNRRNAKIVRNGFWKNYPIRSQTQAYKYLGHGMKMIRFHDYNFERTFGDIDKTKVMIYPRDDFSKII